MTERILPGIGLTGFWDSGAPWKVGGDQNWLRSSVLTQLAVESATTSLPASPLNGVIYIVPVGDVNENQVAARDNGAWVFMPPQEGWAAYVRDTGGRLTFDGTEWAAPLAAQIGTADGGSVQQALNDRVVTVENVAALKTLPPPAFRMVAETRCYSNVGDGGGKTFLWVPASAQADNGGNVIAPGSAPANGRWEWGGPADIRAFGAYPAASAAVNQNAIQRALMAMDHVIVEGGEFDTTLVTQNRPNSRLEIKQGASLHNPTPTASGVVVSGENCTITGGGKIRSEPVFNGDQGEVLYGVIYVTANGFSADDITIDTVPRSGINFKNCTRHSLTNVKIDGKVPKSFYNDTNPNTLNLAAVSYDQLGVAQTNEPGIRVIGCAISNTVQGFFAGNYGATPRDGGVIVTGNNFRQCWDHGVYMTGSASDFSVVNSNTFDHCRRPVVSGGNGAVIIGNTAFETTGDVSMQQEFSIRNPVNCVFVGNSVQGYGASTYFQIVSGATNLTGNLIANNVIKATGPALHGSVIRVGPATVCEDNVIMGNIVEGYPNANFGAIFMTAATSAGSNNSVVENDVTSLTTAYPLHFANQNNGVCARNRMRLKVDAASATTVSMLFLDNVMNSEISNNKFTCKTNGANVSLRGLTLSGTSTGNNFADNSFELTAASLVSATPMVNVIALNNNIRGNNLSKSARMSGTVAWGDTTNFVTVTNANVTADSRITVVPTNASAGSVQKTNGIYITTAAGSFTVNTADAANPAAASTWKFWID